VLTWAGYALAASGFVKQARTLEAMRTQGHLRIFTEEKFLRGHLEEMFWTTSIIKWRSDV
jgi:hypothetical protein